MRVVSTHLLGFVDLDKVERATPARWIRIFQEEEGYSGYYQTSVWLAGVEHRNVTPQRLCDQGSYPHKAELAALELDFAQFVDLWKNAQ